MGIIDQDGLLVIADYFFGVTSFLNIIKEILISFREHS